MNYKEYDKAIDILAKRIADSGVHYVAIYPIPRGGYYPAIELSKILNLPIVTSDDITSDILVVDDICDSGKTVEKFPDNDKAVVFCRERSKDKVNYIGLYSKEG